MLRKAQLDRCEPPPWDNQDSWYQEFAKHPIHDLLSSLNIVGSDY